MSDSMKDFEQSFDSSSNSNPLEFNPRSMYGKEVAAYKGSVGKIVNAVAIGGLASSMFLAACNEAGATPLHPGETQTPSPVAGITEIAPSQETGIVVTEQSYLTESQVLNIDPTGNLEGAYKSFQDNIKKEYPNASFSAWGALAKTNKGESFYTPFFEVRNNGTLVGEWVNLGKSDGSGSIVTMQLKQGEVKGPDGKMYLALSQMENADTGKPLDNPLPYIWIPYSLSQYNALSDTEKANVSVYFSAIPGIVPQGQEQLVPYQGVSKAELSKFVSTETPEVLPTPTALQDLGPEFKATQNPDKTWGISLNIDGKLTPVPDAMYDTSFHIKLDSGRTLDIAPEKMQSEVKWNTEYSLLQVFDENGNITAEFDPGVGDPTSPDYISGQGWIDIKGSADSLACNWDMTNKCIMEEYRGDPNSNWLTMHSTGVLRYLDLKDTQSGDSLMKLTVMQFTSRDLDDKTTTVWVRLQGELASNPGKNIGNGVAYGVVMQIFNDSSVPLAKAARGGQLFSPDTWGMLMKKGTTWTFGFSKYSAPYAWGNVRSNTTIGSPEYNSAIQNFFASKGKSGLQSKFVLIPNNMWTR